MTESARPFATCSCDENKPSVGRTRVGANGSRGRGEERAILDADQAEPQQLPVAHGRTSRAARKTSAQFVLVGAPAAKNRLFLNVPRER